MMPLVQDPETQLVLFNLTLLNSEGEGTDDARAWARKRLVEAGVLKPTPEEAKELEAKMANQQPSPNDEYLKAAAQKAVADAMKAHRRPWRHHEVER